MESAIKNSNEVTLNLSSNVLGNSNDETNFPRKLLLTNTQVSRLRQVLASNSSANIKLLKTELHKIGQSGRFLGRRLEPLLKAGLPLMKNVLKPLAKSVLIPLGLTVAASATDAAIQKKMLGSSMIIVLIVLSDAMDDLTKIIKSLEEFDLLIKGFSETIKKEAKLLGTLAASLLGNLLASK